jgi:hypothetical protein
VSSTRVRKLWRIALWTMGAGVAALVIIATGLYTYEYVVASKAGAGDFERRTAKQIRRLCGRRDDCIVSLHDVVPGDWDTLDYFSTPAAGDVEKRLGVPIQASESMGVFVVLLRNGKVVAVETPDQGVESALANAVYFDCPKRDELLTSCSANSRMRVTHRETEGDPARGISVSGPTYALTAQ